MHWAYKPLPLHTAVIRTDPRRPPHRRRSSDMINVDITAGKWPKFHHKWWDYFRWSINRNGFWLHTPCGGQPPWCCPLLPCPMTIFSSWYSYLCAFCDRSTDTTYDRQDMSNGMWKGWLYNFWGVRKNCESLRNGLGFLVSLSTWVN